MFVIDKHNKEDLMRKRIIIFDMYNLKIYTDYYGSNYGTMVRVQIKDQNSVLSLEEFAKLIANGQDFLRCTQI